MTSYHLNTPGCISAAAVDRPSTPFEVARDDQNAALLNLDELVTNLSIRLGPVLGLESQIGKAEMEKAQPVSTDAALVLVMRIHTHRIQDANERLSALLARLCI